MSKKDFSVDRRALIVTGASAIALTACSSIIGPPEAAPLYMLKAAVLPARGGPRVGWQLSIVLPQAPDSLDTTRIVLVQPGNQMDYYANSSWQDPLPMMVQRALIEAFEGSGRIAGVGRDTDGLKSDYLLETDIRDFQARYDTPDASPTAVVRISAKLISAHGRVIVQEKIVQGEAAAGQNSVPSVVQAFNQAFNETLGQIVAWALSAPSPVKA